MYDSSRCNCNRLSIPKEWIEPGQGLAWFNGLDAPVFEGAAIHLRTPRPHTVFQVVVRDQPGHSQAAVDGRTGGLKMAIKTAQTIADQ